MRFPVSSILTAIVVVALGLGWYCDRTRLARKLESEKEMRNEAEMERQLFEDIAAMNPTIVEISQPEDDYPELPAGNPGD